MVTPCRCARSFDRDRGTWIAERHGMSAALSQPNPHPSRIALAHRAGSAFPLHTMLHGFALHANRRVEIGSHGPRIVIARVRAGDGDPRGRIENVRLEARGGR